MTVHPRTYASDAEALRMIATAQRDGARCAVVSMAPFDVVAATSAGIDIAALIVSQPDDARQAAEVVSTLIRTGCVDLIVTSLGGAS